MVFTLEQPRTWSFGDDPTRFITGRLIEDLCGSTPRTLYPSRDMSRLGTFICRMHEIRQSRGQVRIADIT